MTHFVFDGVGTTSAPYYWVVGHEEAQWGQNQGGSREWPFNDAGTMARLRLSAEQAARGETKYLGSFAKFAEE